MAADQSLLLLARCPWPRSCSVGRQVRRGPSPRHFRVVAEKPDLYRVMGMALKTARNVLEAGTKLVPQGRSVSCATWSAPSIDADGKEICPVPDESTSTSIRLIKEPWLIRLSLWFTYASLKRAYSRHISEHIRSLNCCFSKLIGMVCGLHVVFGFSKAEKPWMVPWTSFTIIQVMFLWFCTFWLVGSWIIPFAAHYIGYSKDTLTYRGQALYSLITDIAEGTVGLGILHRCLARFQPLPRNWFPFSWRGQWYIDVLLGCLTFPVVNRLSQISLELLPFPSPLTSSYEQSIMARDPIASVLYAMVVSVCCPIWEEVIFRGFLLPSLTRYMPMWASILVSAVVFGLAHFNVQRMLPLTFLGLVMGIIFVRSRNLLSSMLLHSLWNGFVFLGLLR